MNGLTTAQVLSLSRKKLLEEGDEIVDDATLLIYGNLTQDDIGIRSFVESDVKSASVTIASGIGTLPADFGTLYGDPYRTVGDIYPEMSIADFARNQSQNATVVEDGELKTYPANSFTLQIKYWPSFAAMTVDVKPTVDPYFHELIVYGILYRAYEDLQDEELSKYYRDKYENEFKLKKSGRSNYDETNQRGGSMFNGIPIVSDGMAGLSSSPDLI